MLHIDNPDVRALLLRGNIGLERESLRVDAEGHMARTPHPFPGNPHIVRDFAENQTEINTPVYPSAHEAVEAMGAYDREIQRTLQGLTPREYLWPFSNPPYIRSDEDVPIAQFEGAERGKTEYREYLSERYGRYKMTLSGIHYNYSFADELLDADYALSGAADVRSYRDRLYLDLAEQASAYGWLMVALTAASPVMDSSYVEKGVYDGDVFLGMGSVRCSELGYWNAFVPILDYTSAAAYADSIQRYVDEGLLKAPSELYYPIRLKPRGANNLETLRESGVDHIELRMFDLNPLTPYGVDERDVRFAQLFLVWLASIPPVRMTPADQIQAAQNYKNAAHYDLKTVRIKTPDGAFCSIADAALQMLGDIRAFYQDAAPEVLAVIDYELAKFTDAENRYAWQLRHAYREHYVEKGMALARALQEQACRD